jgi:hypothetical protein
MADSPRQSLWGRGKSRKWSEIYLVDFKIILDIIIPKGG